MAWYEGNMNNSAGSMLAIWDVELLKNPNWDIYDADPALGANVKVYGHKTNGTRDFCIVAKDNQEDFTTIEIWDDWDTTNHIGVGNSLIYTPGGTTDTLRIRKTIGGYGIRLNDRGFSWINKPWGHHYFLGRSLEFDPTRNLGRGQPIFIGHSSYTGHSAYVNNPMGSNCQNSPGWSCPHCELYNASGGVDQWVVKAGFTLNSSSSYADAATGQFRGKTTAGTYELFETRIQEVGSPYLVIGILEGVCALGQATTGLNNGDIVNVEGISWLCCKGGNASVSFVRMD